MGPLWYFGSSPLARGLRARPVDGPAAGRIIPARAGFTQSTCQNQQSDTDHPRSRGVYCHYRGLLSGRWGSSPLARGLRRRPLRGLAGERIIPARAGFTPTRTGMTRSRPDHPRSRGVYAFAQFQAPDLLDHPRSRGVYASQPNPPPVPIGSSPLARGLLTRRLMDVHARRIIPARAGFTTPGRGARSTSRDHPRSRGVYATMRTRAFLGSGSSPLARGLLGGSEVVVLDDRIIPARAGFTPLLWLQSRLTGDHPRSRGVYFERLEFEFDTGGSSPLARGLPGARLNLGVYHGIIPARAGFTTGTPRGRPSTPDHPRSRGVY